MSISLQLHGLQHTRLPVLHCLPELVKLMSIESVMPSNHLILCNPLLLLPSILTVIIKTKAVKLMTLPKRNFFQGRKWTALGHILRVTDIEGIGLGIGVHLQR